VCNLWWTRPNQLNKIGSSRLVAVRSIVYWVVQKVDTRFYYTNLTIFTVTMQNVWRANITTSILLWPPYLAKTNTILLISMLQWHFRTYIKTIHAMPAKITAYFFTAMLCVVIITYGILFLGWAKKPILYTITCNFQILAVFQNSFTVAFTRIRGNTFDYHPNMCVHNSG